MDVSRKLKMIMLDKDIKQLDVAERFGMSKNTFNNLLQRNSFKLDDIVKIADIIGYEVILQFKDRETGKIIDVERKSTKTAQTDSKMVAQSTPESAKEKTGINKLIETNEAIDNEMNTNTTIEGIQHKETELGQPIHTVGTTPEQSVISQQLQSSVETETTTLSQSKQPALGSQETKSTAEDNADIMQSLGFTKEDFQKSKEEAERWKANQEHKKKEKQEKKKLRMIAIDQSGDN